MPFPIESFGFRPHPSDVLLVGVWLGSDWPHGQFYLLHMMRVSHMISLKSDDFDP